MPELLAPAGNPEKLRAVFRYGADAAYLAGKIFGMRSACDNFSREELLDAVALAKSLGKKIYVTVNTLPRTYQYGELAEYIDFLAASGIDAVIVADIGVFSLIRERAPELEIHISTQASVVSAASANAWHKLGAKRVVLARELTFDEIRDIRKNTPSTLELEAFVHGSMCISYSGRCLISNYLSSRDANRGACSQPCRWNYHVRKFEIAEEKRENLPLPVEEYEDGTFIMSSRDMNMIAHVPELVEAGIDSFKIEGRVKSAYYGAVTTNAYRIAIDRYTADPDKYEFDPALYAELESVSHREFCTGFYFGAPTEGANTVTENGYLREKAYLATVLSYDDKTGRARFVQRNKLTSGDSVEMISPGKIGRSFTVGVIYGEDGAEIPSAPHPGMIFETDVPFPVLPGDIMRGA